MFKEPPASGAVISMRYKIIYNGKNEIQTYYHYDGDKRIRFTITNHFKKQSISQGTLKEMRYLLRLSLFHPPTYRIRLKKD